MGGSPVRSAMTSNTHIQREGEIKRKGERERERGRKKEKTKKKNYTFQHELVRI